MVEKVKDKRKKWIVVISLIIVIILIIFLKLITDFKPNVEGTRKREENYKGVEIIKEIEGNYTGYQLVLIASYGGTGVAGQDLGSGKIVKTYNVSENDVFSEPMLGGEWKLNAIEEETSGNSIGNKSTILKIKKFEENNVQIEIKEDECIVNYNEEVNVSSNAIIFDGINYSYTIKIVKDK